ncbi:pyruvate phosphate dikinase [Legionella gratiana]|uniref:Phosphoenolpyruvate synthase n=1 Tax=Legionella gratiana TaxID=45066 RepID=A0A378J7B8_9GAMM|nr:PEP/pyruvate-binding domain-containing protein [Legionella gratiana]KTD06083.1 pyruvate phosphate dikinase [Legionella gratiana]STX42807.1 pyruvate phosphate dikinase [Legionella gratiana]
MKPFIGLRSKLAVVREVRGETEHRTGGYTPVHEDSSTVSTKQFSTTVAFGTKSIVLCLLFSYANPVYAIPPPETLAFLGGSLVYSGLIVIGLISIFFKYIWIKTKLYMAWRLYLPWIVFILILSVIALSFSKIPAIGIQNTPVTAQTIKHWKETNSQFVFIDLRDSSEYDKIHIAGALNFPAGTGLNDYLKKNTDKKIILYCDNGFKSATLSWLDADQNLLKQVHNEKRLFYFPDGLYQFMDLGEQSPAPVVINIPWEYAQYLLKKASFILLQFKEDALPEYQQIISKKDIPIINYPQSHDELAEQLNNKFKTVNSYFTSNNQVKPFPIASFLMVLGILFVTMFFIRRKELLRSLFAEPSVWYQWGTVLISLIMTVPTIAFSLQLTIPFDVYLYKVDPNLPMNAAYLIPIYMLFVLALGILLMYPKKKRLDFLRYQLSAVFAPTKNRLTVRQISWKTILIPSTCLYVLYLIPLPLSSMLLISIFLLVPIVVDLSLYVLINQFKNSDNHALSLLKQCHYDCDPQGRPFIQINTYSNHSLGTINLTIENQSISLGLFTGLIINNNESSQSTSFQERYDLNEQKRTRLAGMIRNLLVLFQQDIELTLDQEQDIILIKLHHNHHDSRVINRHILLTHYQMIPGHIQEQRFTSLPLQETFANPTPLLLSILKHRWSNEGGCLKALHKLGLLIKKKEITQEQFIAFCNQIYIDNAFEQAIFSSNKLLAWIRNKVVRLQFRLATESILQDYHMLIAPKIQIRIMKLTEYLHQPLSVRKLQRILKQTLTGLYKQSTMWQFYSSLLHQDAFRQLQIAATNTTSHMSELLHSSFEASQSLAIASYYELSDQSNFTTINLNQKSNSNLRDAFLNTEYVRTHLRQFQLKEWQLINLLLEKLTQQLELPISLSYLTMDEFRTLPKKRSALIELLEEGYTTWKLQNQYQFPNTFSLHDIEQLPLNTTEQIVSIQPSAIRVSGNQHICAGTAVVFKEGLNLEALGKSSILIADNLLPEQIISCQHLKGIILKKGGYLSHSSIIAREKNIVMIAQFPIATLNDKSKLIIHSGNQVRVLKNKFIDWDFLEELKDNAAIGNKAQRLALLSHHRFNIPESVILKHNTIKKIYELVSSASEHSLWQEYYEELNQLFELVAAHTPIIVRSSTNVEDSSCYSYAGIFYSQANINNMDEFISAICASWKNMIQRQTLLKEYSGENELTLHLILQPYIKGQAGGVLFTKSETPDLMCVEVASNGIEGVTEGNGALASLRINAQGQTFYEQGEKNILNKKQYQDLYHLGRQLETQFGKAQDIEWIIADQQLYVIQCRDISDKGRLIENQTADRASNEL